MKKKIPLILLIVFIILQFIQPEKNITDSSTGNEIEKHYAVPAEVQSILKTSCYDCHSNNTLYPWYSKIQPAGWFLRLHIVNAKKELNFDEFAAYLPEKQQHKFEEMEEVVTEKEMPLKSYTLIHRDAILSETQAALFIKWTKDMRNRLSSTSPDGIEKNTSKESDD